jgi:hypothetical protein
MSGWPEFILSLPKGRISDEDCTKLNQGKLSSCEGGPNIEKRSLFNIQVVKALIRTPLSHCALF